MAYGARAEGVTDGPHRPLGERCALCFHRGALEPERGKRAGPQLLFRNHPGRDHDLGNDFRGAAAVRLAVGSNTGRASRRPGGAEALAGWLHHYLRVMRDGGLVRIRAAVCGLYPFAGRTLLSGWLRFDAGFRTPPSIAWSVNHVAADATVRPGRRFRGYAELGFDMARREALLFQILLMIILGLEES